MTTLDWIKSTFIKMTKKTYPYGYEDDFVSEMSQLGVIPQGIQKDQWGNYFYKIGESRTIFTSHLDTACQDQVNVNHVIKDNMISTDGSSILGADDKAGATILFWMIRKNIPGLYYFFVGEECGCIGSGNASKYGSEFFKSYDRMISFDRRGTGSVITHQTATRTCSDGFASTLANELNKLGLSYKKDDTGIYTDSAEFVEVISECTNISVGYYNEHTKTESQDILHLSNLAEACTKINWENLPTLRDKTKKEYKSWSDDTESRKSRRYYQDMEWDVEPQERSRFKKTRRGGRGGRNEMPMPVFDSDIKGRKFLDDGMGGLEPFVDSKITTNGKYDPIKHIILSKEFTREEIDILRDQYLDMESESDKFYYSYLSSGFHDSENLK